jgi:hypothetical protein
VGIFPVFSNEIDGHGVEYLGEAPEYEVTVFASLRRGICFREFVVRQDNTAPFFFLREMRIAN